MSSSPPVDISNPQNTPIDIDVVPLFPSTAFLVFHWRCADLAGLTYQSSGDISIALTILGPPPPPPALGGGSVNFDSSVDALDPVNTFTGELFNFYAPDINRGGPMPLAFSRYYASSLKANNITGSLGDNWRHRFEWFMTSTATSATVANHLGRTIDFTKTAGVWNLNGKLDIAFQLIESAATFTLLDPRNGRRYVFSASGRLSSVQDGKGNTHTLVYNGSTQLIQVSDGLGRTLGLTYNAGGQLTGVVGDGGQSIAFTYAGDNLVSSTDALNNTTTYTYDAEGRMTGSTRPEGNTPYTQTWNASDKVASQTDALTNTTQLDYTGTDTTITDPLSNTRVHTYSAGGEITDNQDETGQSFSMDYDNNGRRSSVTDRFGDTTSLTYDPVSGALASITNADGTTTTNIFSTRVQNGFTLRDISGTTYPDGNSESFTYDASGNLLSRTLRDGNQWSFTYNNRGQLLTTTNPLGGTSTRTYNNDATLNSSTDVAGNTTTYTYDGLRRMVMRTHPGAKTVQFAYDNNNRLLTRTDELGQVTGFSYDSNNNLITLTDALGNNASFTPDAMDRVSIVTDALGNSASRGYDALHRLSSVTDRNGNTSTLGYDIQGRLTTRTDALGNVWNRTFDVESILASASDPLNNTYNFTSDNMGRITQITTPLGNVNTLTYDAMGRVIGSQNPLGETTTLDYDANGRRSATSLPGGNIVTTYTRNGLGQLTGIRDPEGNLWQRAYDASGRQSASTDPEGKITTIAYDSRNRPMLATYPGGLGSQSLTYDAGSRLTKRSYSDGTIVNLTYTANDLLVSASQGAVNTLTNTFDSNNRLVANNGIAADYDAGGRLTSITLVTGKVVNYTYDANNRLASVSDWLGGVTTFDYDAAGRIIGMSRPNGVQLTKSYDNNGRLSDIAEGNLSSISLTRDARGQITSAARNLPLMNSANSLSNRISLFDAASQVTGDGYDAMGRLIASSGDTYVWDLASRLTSYTRSGMTVTATYDVAGLLLSRSSGNNTRNYVWNYVLSLPSVSIEKEGANVLRYFIHTPSGELLYSIDTTSGALIYYHYDEQGNTQFLSNAAGSIVASYTYSPYGEKLASSGAVDNLFTWQGQLGVIDEGNGLYYIRARFYDSSTGRFLSRDPIMLTGPRGVNPYQYAYSNPLHYVDATGMKPESELSSDDMKGLGEGLVQAIKNGIGGTNLFIIPRREKDQVAFDQRRRGRELLEEIRIFDEEHKDEFDPLLALDSSNPWSVDFGILAVDFYPSSSSEIDIGENHPDLFGDSSGSYDFDIRALLNGVLSPPDIAPPVLSIECQLNQLREAYRKAVAKLEDAKLLNELDLGDFADDTVEGATDRVDSAARALRARGIDPLGIHNVTTEIQGVICLA